MLVYAAALNGLLAPFLLIIILRICNKKNVMGDHVNTKVNNMFGIIITGVMIVSGIAYIIFSLT